MCYLIQRILYFSLLDCSPYKGYHCHTSKVNLALSTRCAANKRNWYKQGLCLVTWEPRPVFP